MEVFVMGQTESRNEATTCQQSKPSTEHQSSVVPKEVFASIVTLLIFSFDNRHHTFLCHPRTGTRYGKNTEVII
jgi:hypothetical protein